MNRKDFIKLLMVSPLLAGAMKINELENISRSFSTTAKMPVVFIGHGSPMNALYNNTFTQTLSGIAQKIDRPHAIMVVSAHWLTRGTAVSVNTQPETIYDFGGFEDALYRVKYAPPGAPALAKEVPLVAPQYRIHEDEHMGLDHGAWAVLKHIYPAADIPVFQLSIDYTQPPAYHYQLAATLKKMREKGVLIIGSGNITHNLRMLNWSSIDAPPFDWAQEFDEIVKARLDASDFGALVNYEQYGFLAKTAVPTNDHYLPMLYVLGLADKHEQVRYLFEGFQYGSLSMRCFMIA